MYMEFRVVIVFVDAALSANGPTKAAASVAVNNCNKHSMVAGTHTSSVSDNRSCSNGITSTSLFWTSFRYVKRVPRCDAPE